MFIKKASVVALAAVGLFTVSQGAAHADNGVWHGISGTVYANGDWFRSSTVRAVGPTATSISVSFGSTPTAGIDFNVIDYATNQWHGVIWDAALGPNYELSAGDVWYGKQFQNNFKQDSTPIAGFSSYNFSGSENY